MAQLKKDIEEGELPIGKVAQATKADVADWSASAHESEYAWEAEKLADTAPAVKEAEHATEADSAERLKLDMLCATTDIYKLGEKDYGLYAVNIKPPNSTTHYTVLLSIRQETTFVMGSEVEGVSAYYTVSSDGDGSRMIRPLKDGVVAGSITSVYRIADYGISFG
jgi:hypothetical protein